MLPRSGQALSFIVVYTLRRATLLAGSKSTEFIGIAFTTTVNKLATNATLGIVIPAQCRARTGSGISLHGAYIRQFYCKNSSVTTRSCQWGTTREMFKSNIGGKRVLNKPNTLTRVLLIINRLMLRLCAEQSHSTLLSYISVKIINIIKFRNIIKSYLDFISQTFFILYKMMIFLHFNKFYIGYLKGKYNTLYTILLWIRFTWWIISELSDYKIY